jgi:hypothetical protein
MKDVLKILYQRCPLSRETPRAGISKRRGRRKQEEGINPKDSG